MNLLLTRDVFSNTFTLGKLDINGEFFCYTCEDRVRPKGIKIWGETAIPPGEYHISLTWSNRFKKVLPLIVSVPGFEGIRIHSGNTADDTEGCVLLGKTRTDNGVGDSRKAMAEIMPILKSAWDADHIIKIEVV